jgi:GNAT superfamily N-acetyltransferase
MRPATSGSVAILHNRRAVAAGAEIREFERSDAAAAARLVSELVPEIVATEAVVAHWIFEQPARARARAWVAVRGGEVVGWAEAGLRWSAAEAQEADVWAGVRADARGAGLGSRLVALAEAHVAAHGATVLRSETDDTAEALGFAARRGYAETGRERYSTLDPAAADLSGLAALEAAKAGEGYRLATLAELLDRPRDLHALYDAAHRDMPSDSPRAALEYGEWVGETLGNPALHAEASPTILHGERPVALCWLLVDVAAGKADHELTGTAPDHRGRGLARLAKLAAVRWCREHGIRTMVTSNAAENAPMLAVNERLGFRPAIVRVNLLRRV